MTTWCSSDGCRHVTGLPPTPANPHWETMDRRGPLSSRDAHRMELFPQDSAGPESETHKLASRHGWNTPWRKCCRQHGRTSVQQSRHQWTTGILTSPSQETARQIQKTTMFQTLAPIKRRDRAALVSIGAVIIMQAHPPNSEYNRASDAQTQKESSAPTENSIEAQATDSATDTPPTTTVLNVNSNGNRNPTMGGGHEGAFGIQGLAPLSRTHGDAS